MRASERRRINVLGGIIFKVKLTSFPLPFDYIANGPNNPEMVRLERLFEQQHLVRLVQWMDTARTVWTNELRDFGVHCFPDGLPWYA